MTTAQDGGKVVSPKHRPLLPPGNAPGTHFCYRLSGPQGQSAIGRIMSMKIPMKLAGIEPATFRFVAQHLNYKGLRSINCNITIQTGRLRPPTHKHTFNFTGQPWLYYDLAQIQNFKWPKRERSKNECIRTVRCPDESENCFSQKTGSLLLQMWEIPNMETNQRIAVLTDSNERQTKVRNRHLYDSVTVTSAM